MNKKESIENFIKLVNEDSLGHIKLVSDKVDDYQDTLMLKIMEIDEWKNGIEKRLDKIDLILNKIEKHLFNK